MAGDFGATAGGRNHFDAPEPFGASVSKMFRPVDLAHVARGPFVGEVEARSIDDLLVAHVDASPHEIWHTGGAVATERDAEPDASDGAADDAIKVFVPLNGAAVLAQGDREVVLRPGSIGLVATARDYRVLGEAGFDFLILMLPRRGLGLRSEEVTELAASALAAAHGVEGVVVPYLANLAGNLDVFRGSTGSRVAHTTSELLSTLLHAQLAPRLSAAGVQRAELLEQARSYVLRHLTDRALSPGSIAAALHVSQRHLQQLFSEQGETIASYVRVERLNAARLDLTDPARSYLTIADIAAEYGFTDGAHFSKAFKELFGETPSAWRRGG